MRHPFIIGTMIGGIAVTATYFAFIGIFTLCMHLGMHA